MPDELPSSIHITEGLTVEVLKDHTDEVLALIREAAADKFAATSQRVEDLQIQVDRRFTHSESNSKDMHEAIKATIKAALDARASAVEDRFSALERLMDTRFESTERAVNKAETAAEKRFDSVNEFRGQLADQAASFLPRREAETEFRSVREAQDNLRKEITDLRASRDSGAGRTMGVDASRNLLLAVVPIILTIILVAFGIAAYLHK